MAALATRAFVAAGQDFYLCPLSENQISRAERQELLQPVFDGTQALEPVWRPGAEGQPDELVAEGFSVDVELTAQWARPDGAVDGAALAGAFVWRTRRPRRRPWNAVCSRPRPRCTN